MLRAAILTSIVALALAAPAGAAVIDVTSTDDEFGGFNGSGCSLREAIEAANTNAAFGGCPAGSGGDTIRIPAGDYLLDIDSASSEIPNPPGEGDLNVTSQITFDGAGPGATKLDGAGLDRLFYVSAGLSRVTFKDLTIQHGLPDNPSMRYGGGIYADSPLTIANVRILDNGASVAGGVYAGEGAIVRDSVFELNVADLGVAGGAYFGGATTITSSKFIGNTTEQLGGGFLSSQGTTHADGLVVRGNEAQQGGGIGVSSGALVLTDSRVTGNDAVRGGGAGHRGGGISTQDSNLTVRSSTISGNSSFLQGGGIHTQGGRITVDRVTFAGNDAGGFGGGLAAEEFSPADVNRVRITGSTFRGNHADVAGGGINLNGGAGGSTFPVTIDRTLVAGNEAGVESSSGPFQGYADGIRSQAVLTLLNSTITENKDPLRKGDGGGLVNVGSATLRNVTITANRAAINGDNLYSQGPMTMKNSIVGDSGAAGSCFEAVAITSEGRNLEFDTGGGRCVNGSGDRVVARPRIGPLASNGGPTLTRILRTGSPALDTGRDCTGKDQRGAPRSLGGRCDVGAYELVRCRGVLVNRVGTGGADVLRGTRRPDGILGLGGKDTLRGRGAGDGLCGGAGRDSLLGGGGPDRLHGGPAADFCHGGPGTDGATACEHRRSIP